MLDGDLFEGIMHARTTTVCVAFVLDVKFTILC